MPNLSRHILWVILFFWASQCTNHPTTAGGGLDTESSGGKLVGKVHFPNGQAAKNTEVTLIPDKFLPFIPDSLTITLTDSFGVYEFDNIDSGLYNISAVNLDSGYRFFHPNIFIKEYDSIETVSGTLKTPGAITLSLNNSTSGGFVYIPGTTIFKQLSDTLKNITIDSVPADAALSVFYRKNAGSNDSTIAENISVSPGTVYNIFDLSAWNYSRRIRFNTKEAALHTASDIYDIPVLLRFSSSNFKFSEVRYSNDDIRFMKTDGKQMQFEIERWDSLNDSGEIWVNIDTLHANDSLQSFLMVWGNINSPGRSDSALVFDTACGFAGVWHIDGEKDGIRNRDVYKDATYYRNHGIDYIHARGIDGIVGYGKQFNGTDDYIFIKDSDAYHFGSNPFTISLWFNKSSSQNGTLVLYKYTDDETGELAIATDTDNFIFVYSRNLASFDTLCETSPVTLNEWHFVTLVQNQSGNLELFLDGESVNDTIYNFNISNSGSGSGIFIGSSNTDQESEPFNAFDGFIDEVRFESVARTNEWIRVVYNNIIGNDINNSFLIHNDNKGE